MSLVVGIPGVVPTRNTNPKSEHLFAFPLGVGSTAQTQERDMAVMCFAWQRGQLTALNDEIWSQLK